LGHVKEIDEVLSKVANDPGFPDSLRHDLEALRHFRAFYGKDGELQPTYWLKRQKVAVMEAAWGSHLLEELRRRLTNLAKRSA
jgi:hypothetical protein